MGVCPCRNAHFTESVYDQKTAKASFRLKTKVWNPKKRQTTNRSIDAIPSAWLRRNVFHPCDGGFLILAMYLATEVWPISMPSLRSSPWISRSAPQRIGETHFPDQSANFERHLWPAAVRSRLPSPEQAKTGAMPADNRLRLYDNQGIHNAWRNPIKAGKNETIESGEGNSLRRFLRSTLSWWRSATISASSEARDRNSPMTTHEISLSISPMRRSIARFAVMRRWDRVYDKDRSWATH